MKEGSLKVVRGIRSTYLGRSPARVRAIVWRAPGPRVKLLQPLLPGLLRASLNPGTQPALLTSLPLLYFLPLLHLLSQTLHVAINSRTSSSSLYVPCLPRVPALEHSYHGPIIPTETPLYGKLGKRQRRRNNHTIIFIDTQSHVDRRLMKIPDKWSQVAEESRD